MPKHVLKNPLATQNRSPNIQMPSLLNSMMNEKGRHRTAVKKSDNESDMMNALVTVRSCLCFMMTMTTAEFPRLDRRKMERRMRACAATAMPWRMELLSAALRTDGVSAWWPGPSSLPPACCCCMISDWFPSVPTVPSVVAVTRVVTMETTLGMTGEEVLSWWWLLFACSAVVADKSITAAQ